MYIVSHLGFVDVAGSGLLRVSKHLVRHLTHVHDGYWIVSQTVSQSSKHSNFSYLVGGVGGGVYLFAF